MAIWMGESGGIRIERLESGMFYARISPSDVDTGSKRFGFDRPVTALITGDQVAITRVDEQGQPVSDPLDFVAATGWKDGVQHPDGQWYVSVDPVGGIRLFRDWPAALLGNPAQAVELEEPSDSYRLAMQVRSGVERCLAQTVSWELNTNRAVADITSLGEGFQKNMATLVSGSGTLDCLFDATQGMCHGDINHESSIYMHQLALRQEIGSSFKAVLLLKRKGCVALWGDDRITDNELFYSCDCVISDVATGVESGEVIHSRINFVTTGQIQLLYSSPADYLLQETMPGEDKVLQESDFGIYLETPA